MMKSKILISSISFTLPRGKEIQKIDLFSILSVYFLLLQFNFVYWLIRVPLHKLFWITHTNQEPWMVSVSSPVSIMSSDRLRASWGVIVNRVTLASVWLRWLLMRPFYWHHSGGTNLWVVWSAGGRGGTERQWTWKWLQDQLLTLFFICLETMKEDEIASSLVLNQYEKPSCRFSKGAIN